MATKTMKIGLSNADKNTMSSQVALETINKLIDAYSTSKQYEVGDYVNNAGIIYICIEATSGTWDSTKWKVKTLNDVFDDINKNKNISLAISDELTNFQIYQDYDTRNVYNARAWTPSTIISGKYYKDGVEKSADYVAHTGFFEILPNTQYTVGLIPVFGNCTLPSYSLDVVMSFFDENKNYLGQVLKTNPTFTTPKGTKYAVINLMYGTGGVDFSIVNNRCVIYKGSSLPQTLPFYFPVLKTKNHIGNIDNQIDIYNEKLYTYQEIDNLTFVSETCWSLNINNFFTAPWSYTVINLSDYDIKSLKVQSATNNACPALVFFNGDPLNGGTLISYMLLGSVENGIDIVSANDIQIPINCTHVLYQYRNEYASQCYFQGKQFRNLSATGSTETPLYVTWNKTNVKLTANAKFNDTKDLCVELGKRGPNEIFDFKKWYFNNNSERYPAQVSSGVQYASNGTDFFGPWIINAVNNIDGDNTGSGNFTGGNHGYDNTGSTTNNSATGRTVSVDVRVDGQLVSEFEGYCSRIDINWVNRVQAYNTTKSDGSGREVLEERYHMWFDGFEWKVEGNPLALEDIKVKTYYGLQFAAFGSVSAINKVEYYGDDLDSQYAANENSHAASKNCLGIIYSDVNNNFKCRLFIDTTKGLGRNSLNNDTSYSLFYTSYGKGYGSFIINSSGVSVDEGKSMYFTGSYRFEPIIVNE